MRIRSIFVSIATLGLLTGPALANGLLGSAAGAKAECTITGTAAGDDINGTTRDDVICTKAGQDTASGDEGNDIIRLGQGDDEGFGDDGSDVVKGQQDDEQFVEQCIEQAPPHRQPRGDGDCGKGGILIIVSYGLQGNDQNDKVYGGNGDDDLFGGNGNDLLKSRDRVSGNDSVNGEANTDTCRIDAGDQVTSCEL